MNPRCNPIHRKGNRNVFCRYYGDCLDYIIEKSWRGWDCSGCRHRSNEGAKPEIRLKATETIYYHGIRFNIDEIAGHDGDY